MNKLRSIIAANRNFLLCYVFCFLAGLIFLLVEGKSATFLYLNPYHNNPIDIFFIYYTYLGDGLFTIAVILLLLLIKRYSWACQILIAFILSSLLAQIMKNVFSMPRPSEFFHRGEYTYFIQGVTHHGFNSFPSGHSTSVFALATLLAIFEDNKKWNILYLFGAIAVGYSRIYLGQHFLSDVLIGSLLGVLSAILVRWLFIEKFHSFFRYT